MPTLAMGKVFQELIKSFSEKFKGMDEYRVAERVYASMSAEDKKRAALAHVSNLVWSLRRDEQLKIERQAAARNSEFSRKKQAEFRARDEAARWAEEQEQRKKAEAAYDHKCDRQDEKFAAALEDFTFMPKGWLLNPKSRETEEFQEWLSRNCYKVKSPKMSTRDMSPRTHYLLSACEHHGVPRKDWVDILIAWGVVSDVFALIIEDEIIKESERIRLELTAELLGSQFALGDGVRVTWSAATVDQHLQRVAMTTNNAVSNAEDAARHLAAVRMLKDARAETLGDLATLL